MVGHPIIDIDGHVVEHRPSLLPHLRDGLGTALFDRYEAGEFRQFFTTPGTDRASRAPMRAPNSGWWGLPTRHALDLASAMIPALLDERLDELGIDQTVLYPTLGFGIAGVPHEELRVGLCRGYNSYLATAYAPYAARLVIAGVVPMHTPGEALAGLEQLRALGLRVAAFPHGVVRPIDQPHAEPAGCMWPGQTHWIDTFGLDSAYDYDPVWRRCAELDIAPTFHGGLLLDSRHFRSVSNFVADHLGLHASMMQPLARSLLFGGVLHRFPELRFGLLECGVGWASTMLCDLVEHYERRSLDGLAATDPANLDAPALAALLERYGLDSSVVAALGATSGPPAAERDEFRLTGAAGAQDLAAQFARGFVFGAEADDRGIAHAFSPAHPFGIELAVGFSSDMGHWDVDGFAGIVASAWAHVQARRLTVEQFRKYTYENPRRLIAAAHSHDLA